MTIVHEITHFHLFCGSGGGAIGFQRAQARVGTLTARMRCLGGIDSDPAACRDFTRFLGVQATCLDLFDEQQYREFHGRAPPAGWREATAEDLLRAAGGECPRIVFGSAPCKGFSGLLNKAAAASIRYQALNRLTVRSVRLMLEAFQEDLPDLFIFENVPRIAQRGRELLDDIIHELEISGYRVAETTHDCGELGGLAQHRRRYLLVARRVETIPPHLYEPPRHRVRGVGEVIGELPMPDDPAAGPMHRCPRLEWRTWLRLALIPAGGDWRSLAELDFEALRVEPWHGGVLGVQAWGSPSGTVAARCSPTNGAFSVADPRPGNTQAGGARYNDVFRVVRWDGPAGAVTSGAGPSSGGQAVADPRPPGSVVERDGHVYGVTRWNQAAETVTGQSLAGGGRFSVADPRAATEWGGKGKYRVTGWDEAAGTAIAESATGNGAFAVADPRWGRGLGEHSKMRVEAWGDPSHTVTSSDRVGSGALSVADPRAVPAFQNLCRVEPWDGPAHTIVGATRPAGGALSVADPRLLGTKQLGGAFASDGRYGVLGWCSASNAVTGNACQDNGAWSIADPRPLPLDGDRLVPLIFALDGTWHRPFTTLELAALQGYPVEELMLAPLDGRSDTGWRLHIGNSVPPPAAEAIGSVMAEVILQVRAGAIWRLDNRPIWVRQLGVALSVAGGGL